MKKNVCKLDIQHRESYSIFCLLNRRRQKYKTLLEDYESMSFYELTEKEKKAYDGKIFILETKIEELERVIQGVYQRTEYLENQEYLENKK